MTERAGEVDGFRLAYEQRGQGPLVVLLHGWPGDRHDYDDVVSGLTGVAHVVTPDLRGFGDTGGSPDPVDAYSAEAQARSVAALIEEIVDGPAVLGGYDLGGRVAQELARTRPDLVAGLVLSPPLPGAGSRLLAPAALRHYWYQEFHQTPLVEQLVDGDVDRVRHYLAHFWEVWSAPGYTPDPARLDRLAAHYGRPGALTASIAYYRTGSGAVAQALRERPPAAGDRISAPTVVVWPGDDPIVTVEWSDRIDAFFAHAEVQIVYAAGHFTPVEAPLEFAAAVRRLLG